MNAVVIIVLVIGLGTMFGLYKWVQKKNEAKKPILKDGKPIKDLPGDEPKERP